MAEKHATFATGLLRTDDKCSFCTTLPSMALAKERRRHVCRMPPILPPLTFNNGIALAGWRGAIQSCNLASPPGTGPILRGICCRGTVEGCGKQGSPTGQQHREGRPLLTFLYSILLFGSGVCHQVANFTTALEDYRTIELPPTQVDPLLPRPYVVYVV